MKKNKSAAKFMNNMKKFFTWMLVTMMTCGFGLMQGSCSSDDNETNGKSEENVPDASGQVVFMYYAVGGGNLDYSTERALANMGVEQQKVKGVRSFVQYKYSKTRDPRITNSYEFSGENGCVYRFEIDKNSLNPKFDDYLYEVKAFTGKGFKKFAGSDFKMYDPDNLAEFINWCMEQAPNAKAYVLAFGDHGGAYDVSNDYNKGMKTRGVMYDDNLEGEPCMSPTEIGIALDKLTRKPDMIFFDCCLMNTLEVLGELQGKTNFVFASGHVVYQSPLDELVHSLAGIAKADNVSEGIKKYMSEYVTTITKKMENKLHDNEGERIKRSINYVLTDMSKLPALFASLKGVTDFLDKTDISGMEIGLFDDAASGCYHYVDNRPFFDMVDYLNQLKKIVFKDNTEFANLVGQVETAAKACQIAHDEFSYDSKGTNKKYDLSYSVTLGFSSSRFIFDGDTKKMAPSEPQGVIMSVIRAGKGTSDSPYYNDYLLEKGDNFLASWIASEKQEENIININRYYKKGSGVHQSWDNTYRTLQFDKAVGWSRWMKKNPGIHYDNPPYDEEYSYVFEDPDFDDFIEDTDSID